MTDDRIDEYVNCQLSSLQHQKKKIFPTRQFRFLPTVVSLSSAVAKKSREEKK